MGSGTSTRINEHNKIEVTMKFTGFADLDKLLLITQDLIKLVEQLRCRIVSYYDLMFRIVKLHTYKDVHLIDAFKVWYMCTLTCNDGKEDGVQFLCKIDDFEKEQLSEEFKKLLNFGSTVAYSIEEGFVRAEKEQLIISNTGICGDFKLQLWPFICSSFLSYLRSAFKLIPYVEELFSKYIDQIKKQVESQEKQTGNKIKTLNIQLYSGVAAQIRRFKDVICEYHQEVKEFTNKYKEVMEECHPISHQIIREEGNQNYILNDDRTILKSKIQDLVKKYLPFLTPKDSHLLNHELEMKAHRRKVKPKIKLERRRTEQAAMTFPTQYHWVGHNRFDTFFSSQSLSLQELEEARQHGEEARKKVLKISGVNQWKDNSMKSVFECFTWVLSAEFGGKLKEQDFKLLEEDPWIVFNRHKKHKYTSQSSLIYEHLTVWLKYFSPRAFLRLQNHYRDFMERQENLELNKFDFHHEIRDLPTHNQYNALSSFSKNIRINETYFSKIQKLFEFTMKYNGDMGDSLYRHWQELVNQADLSNYVLNTPFTEFLKSFRPGTIADVDQIEVRKTERRQTKLSIACIEI